MYFKTKNFNNTRKLQLILIYEKKQNHDITSAYLQNKSFLRRSLVSSASDFNSLSHFYHTFTSYR